MAHYVKLTNTTGTSTTLAPSGSPLVLTLSAQPSGTKFDYGTTFPNVASTYLEPDDGQDPVLVLTWPSSTDPQWSLTRTSGTTSYTSTVVGQSTRFTLDLPATGNITSFTLASAASDPHTQIVSVKRQ